MHRPKFPLFFSHIDLAHQYWERLLVPGDIAIDATCGNGFDTAFLAKILLHGRVIAMDKQADAIAASKEKIEKELGNEVCKNIEFYHQCHSTFPDKILKETIKLIVYNLGYLPKGDKSIITASSSTLASLAKALDLIQPGGAISVTCYPGHPGGDEEEIAVLEFAKNLDPQLWSCFHHSRINKAKSPSLLLLQKSGSVSGSGLIV
jgi:SAM-dependent methyltransferase